MPNTHLTRQIGEHLVVAELGRQGILATPFAGNMPHYDIVALTSIGKSVYIQVKAINKGDWQLNAKRFIEINIDPSEQQTIGRVKSTPVAPLFFVFVSLKEPGKDVFYFADYRTVGAIVKKHYTRKHGKSTHFAMRLIYLHQYLLQDWTTVENAINKGRQ